MDILLVGFHIPETMSWYMEKNLKILGHKVDVFCYRTINQKIPANYIIPTFFRHAPIFDKIYLLKMNRELIAFSKKKKYDLCVVLKGESLFPETIDKLKANCSKVINWFFDPICTLDKDFFKSIPKYDLFFVKDMFIKKRLIQIGFKNIDFLLEAFDENIYHPIDKKEIFYQNDISFVGNIYPYRFKLLEPINEHNKYHVKLYGNLVQIKKGELGQYFEYHKKAIAQEKNLIFNTAKIVFNSHNPYEIEGANVRLFEICGSGSFQITDSTLYTKNIFEPNKEIVVYHNIDELKKLVEYYLKHEDKRNEIKKNGLKRALKEHTYIHRIKTLMNKIYKR